MPVTNTGEAETGDKGVRYSLPWIHRKTLSQHTNRVITTCDHKRDQFLPYLTALIRCREVAIAPSKI